MKEVEDQSYRGMLIEVIVKSLTEHYFFDVGDNLKEVLQERLNSNLRFETNVSDVEIENEQIFGKISFEDENGLIKVISFTTTAGLGCSRVYKND